MEMQRQMFTIGSKRTMALGSALVFALLAGSARSAGPPGGLDVKVVNVPDVNVVNTPLDVKLQPQQFEQIAVDFVYIGKNCFTSEVIYTVPNGFRLRIVEAAALMHDDVNPDLTITDNTRVSLQSVADNNFWRMTIAGDRFLPFVGGRSMDIFADAGEDVMAGYSGCNNPVAGRVEMIGRLVPVVD